MNSNSANTEVMSFQSDASFPERDLSEPPAYSAAERFAAFQEAAEREERWARFIGECCDFARSERDGFAAVLRAVSEAMKTR